MNSGKNTRQIGREFEEKAFEFLKTEFDTVEWLSKEKNSTFDFQCTRNGKVYHVDAKAGESPNITYRQREVDYLVVNGKKGIEIWDKERITKLKPIGKEMVSISIRTEDYTKLCKLKVHPSQPIWEIIKSLLNKIGGNKNGTHTRTDIGRSTEDPR